MVLRVGDLIRGGPGPRADDKGAPEQPSPCKAAPSPEQPAAPAWPWPAPVAFSPEQFEEIKAMLRPLGELARHVLDEVKTDLEREAARTAVDERHGGDQHHG